jgi:hypothetical protein
LKIEERKKKKLKMKMEMEMGRRRRKGLNGLVSDQVFSTIYEQAQERKKEGKT